MFLLLALIFGSLVIYGLGMLLGAGALITVGLNRASNGLFGPLMFWMVALAVIGWAFLS